MTKSDYPAELAMPLIKNAVEAALLEDLGMAGDVTSQATIAPSATAAAVMNSREDGIISGVALAREAFWQIDPELSFEALVSDGDRVKPGDDVIKVHGNARHIMSAERVALNFMCHMSGIASHTDAFAKKIEGTGAKICCTRKTTPGLRAFEKYAVKCGGGSNHRFGLDDAILIKDNHIAAAGGVRPVLQAVKAKASHMIRTEIEVDRLDQLAEVLEVGGASVVLLDNMDNDTLREAVAMVDGQMQTEASGNVTLERVASIAATGVDYISSGALTHSARTVDLGLDF